MTSKFADMTFPPSRRGGKTTRNLYNRIFSVLSNSKGFVTLSALTEKVNAGSKASVSTRIAEMEAILGKQFNTVSVSTGSNRGAEVAYSI
jgi:hypothetical protein